MKRKAPWILFLILVTLVSCSKKESAAVESKTEEPLVVAMELQFPPFEMAAADGSPTGISVDTAYALGEYLGRPIVIENTAWTGLIPSIQSG
ncbi:MAG: transporter substrate-binding domain-containing protein, partial [Spirochaetales bacterium]|nr:transporter substrate-binding domain-containing protein [Spirochaetales bacterium]